ncbi:MAG: hypothetical protein SAL70_32345 [Scytonema sp. PMC 1070.18]|nr:hypothetical protein [Scytonema sp. PMC 1070.18]
MLKKIFLPTLVISSALFGAFLFLLAIQGSKPVKIQVESQEVFYGELKDIVSPATGATLSLGLGLAGALVVGLQQSVRQSSELEKQLSDLQNVISEKESQLEALKLSPYNPTLAQLTWFLEEDDNKLQTMTSNVTDKGQGQNLSTVSTKTELQELTATQEEATKPIVITSTVYETKPITMNQLSVQTATSILPSAQSVLGLSQKYGNKTSVVKA